MYTGRDYERHVHNCDRAMLQLCRHIKHHIIRNKIHKNENTGFYIQRQNIIYNNISIQEVYLYRQPDEAGNTQLNTVIPQNKMY